MQTLPDYHLDALFRAALEEQADALASTAASESQMLERVGRVLARRRTPEIRVQDWPQRGGRPHDGLCRRA